MYEAIDRREFPLSMDFRVWSMDTCGSMANGYGNTDLVLRCRMRDYSYFELPVGTEWKGGSALFLLFWSSTCHLPVPVPGGGGGCSRSHQVQYKTSTPYAIRVNLTRTVRYCTEYSATTVSMR